MDGGQSERDLGNLWSEKEITIATKVGIYHPVGTIRIGNSKKNGVVDKNLKVFGFNNASCFSTAFFPISGGANPTFTLMLVNLSFS